MEISKGFYHIIILLKLHPVALNQSTILGQNDNGIVVEWNILDLLLIFLLVIYFT